MLSSRRLTVLVGLATVVVRARQRWSVYAVVLQSSLSGELELGWTHVLTQSLPLLSLQHCDNTNMIVTNCDNDLEDIFNVTDSLDTDDLESFLDSRLDVESVLIEDIKLETDMAVYCSDSQSSAEGGEMQAVSQEMPGTSRTLSGSD